jgi:hypothetical protein
VRVLTSFLEFLLHAMIGLLLAIKFLAGFIIDIPSMLRNSPR